MTSTEMNSDEKVYILHPLLVPVYEDGSRISEDRLGNLNKSDVFWRRNSHTRIFRTNELEIPSHIKLPQPVQYFLENPDLFLELPLEEINRLTTAFGEIIPKYERLDEEEYQASQQYYFQEGIYLAGCTFHHPMRIDDFNKGFPFYEKCFRESYLIKNEKNPAKIKDVGPAKLTGLEMLIALAGLARAG